MEFVVGKDVEWTKGREVNADSDYGMAVFDFAEAWAEEMERMLAAEERLVAQVAKEAERTALDRVPGLTGFQYGMAVSMLAQAWKRGEELRRWHNLAVQIGNEGEIANEMGGTLNPALLTVTRTT